MTNSSNQKKAMRSKGKDCSESIEGLTTPTGAASPNSFLLRGITGDIAENQELLNKTMVTADCSIMEGLAVLNRGGLGILLVVDQDRRLLGVVTDGDVRRAILARRSLEDPIDTIMNRKPVTARSDETRSSIRAKMQARSLRHMPVLDPIGQLVGLELALELRGLNNPPLVVIMAGGLGTRLLPLTENRPKPLVEVAGKPILEHLIEELSAQGLKRIILSVNYKSEMIEEYFGDGSAWDVSIGYLRETEPLGTAGSLSLLGDSTGSSILVLNGDLLTNTNFQALIRFHSDNESAITVGITEMSYKVPYGVVDIDNHHFLSVKEKPEQKFFVNAGIYVLKPEMVERIPKDSYFEMTTLLEMAQEDSLVTVFPIHEYWRDVGEKQSYDRAQCEVDDRLREPA